MKKLFYFLTGGRPMTLSSVPGFRDIVVNEMVFYFRDYYGRLWMAGSRWSWFRVKSVGFE